MYKACVSGFRAQRVFRNYKVRFSVCFFQNLQRHVMSYIITYYLPSGLCVVVAWISFRIRRDIVEGGWGA